MAQSAIDAEREDIDAIRVTSRGRRLAGEPGAERFPVMPARSVPVPVTKLAVVVDGEELALSAIAP